MTTLPQVFVVLANVILAGQVMDGSCVSVMVTVNEQVAVLPAASVTTNVFVVVPTGKVAPLARPAVWAVVCPGQLSVPIGAA